MTTLALITPIDPGTNTRVNVRVTSSQAADATGAAGEIWWPAITTQPVLQMALFDGDFSSAVEPGSANIELRLDVLDNAGTFPRVLRYNWAGAKVTLYRLVSGAPVILAEMKVERFAVEDFRLALALAIDAEPFDADVLFLTYAGTTGAEGGADLAGRVKPWVFGRALNVEPVFIDQIDNVFQVSGYGPVSAIPTVYERGASFGASIGNFASYAALVAAAIPEGRWGTCLAEGMFRLGAPPAGVITCDVDGDTTSGFLRRTGAVIKEVARRLSLSSAVNATSLDALDAAVARNINIVISEQTTLLDLARRMVAPCNAVAGLNFDGRLITPRVAIGAPGMTLDAQGRQMPPVLGMARQNTSPPYKRIQIGAARSWRVHSFDEIAFFADLIDRGLYSGSEVYREGNLVETADKARWVYVNPTASSGNAPPTWPTTSNSFWSNIAPPIGGDLIGGIVAPANANRVPYSRAESNRGWAFGGDVVGPSPVQVVSDGRYYIVSQPIPFTAASQNAFLLGSPTFPVIPGERLSASSLIRISPISGPNPASWQIYIQYVDVAGANLTATDIASGSGGVSIADGRFSAFSTVPANARSALLVLRCVSSGAGSMEMYVLEPMVASAAADQTVHPQYSPGPNARDGADPNNIITINGSGQLQGIGSGSGTEVSNGRVTLGNLNRVRFSRFEGKRGWAVIESTFASNTAFDVIAAEGRDFIGLSATASAGGQNMTIGCSPRFPAIAGERLSVSASVRVSPASGPAPTLWRFDIGWFDASGSGISTSSIALGSGTVAGSIVSAFVTAPANAQSARLTLRGESSGAGTLEFRIGSPMVTSAAAVQAVHPPFSPGPNSDDGSDISVLITGPKTASFTYTSTGALDPSAQLSANLVYQLSNQYGPITSGVTWQYRIIEGIVNTFAAGVTLRSMSVSSGAGTFNLSNLGSNTARVEIIATFGTNQMVSELLDLTKIFAAPNSSGSGGGGGGAATATQTSGFASVTSSTAATVSNELQVTSTTTTQTVDVQLSFNPPAGAESDSTIEVQVERWNGSAWVAMGAAMTANSSVTFVAIGGGTYIRAPAVFEFQRTSTITAGSNQRTRIRARRTAGSVTHSTSGTLTLSA